MKARVNELIMEINKNLIELSHLLYQEKIDDFPPIELTQVFTDEDALAQLND